MTHDLILQWRIYSIPKLGNDPGENEDAAYPPGSNSPTYLGRGETFSCALSDGATQSSFSRLWANLLAEEASKASVFTSEPGDILENAVPRWKRHVDQIDLPWHAQDKVKFGAFATLVWLGVTCHGTKSGSRSGQWKALVLGDSCLFHLRENKPISIVPQFPGPDFSKNPVLFSSNTARNKPILRDISTHIASGDWKPTDQFILVTDALAEWIFKGLQIDAEPFKIIQRIVLDSSLDSTPFRNWVNTLRENKAIKNDDTTMAHLILGQAPG